MLLMALGESYFLTHPNIVCVLILFRGLFLKVFTEITNSFRNNKSSTSLKTYLINLIVNLASKFDDHNLNQKMDLAKYRKEYK